MSTAVVRWSRMGPVSSPSSAQNTVKPASWSPSIRVLGGGGRGEGEELAKVAVSGALVLKSLQAMLLKTVLWHDFHYIILLLFVGVVGCV